MGPEGLQLDGVALAGLARRYDTPLYLYARKRIETGMESLTAAWSGVRHRILYSVKANSNLALLEILADLGAGADVVSGGELARALRAGFPADRIVFAGAGKTDEELAAALAARISLIHVESAGEFQRLRRLVHARGVATSLAFRITPQVVGGTHAYTETGTSVTKFGISADEALRLSLEAASDPLLRIEGLHVHFGSQILSPEPFGHAAARARHEFLRFRAAGVPLTSLNLGGGIGIPYRGEPAPTPADIVAAMKPHLLDLPMTLSMEPGRFLVGPAGWLLTRVLDLKRTDQRTFCIVDAAMTDLIRPALYGAYHDIVPVVGPDRPTEAMDVVGPVCESGDFLARDRDLPACEPGELLVVKDVGAYGFAMSSNYNSRPRAAEVLVHDGQARLIRRRETVEDSWLTELG